MKKFGYPEVVVGTFILNRQGELLLTKSKKWPGTLLRAGRARGDGGEHERIRQSAETEEEVGLRIKFVPRNLLAGSDIPEGIPQESAIHIHRRAVQGKKHKSEKLDNKELYDYIWIKPKASLKLKLNTYTRRAIMQMVGKGKKKNWLYAKTK